MSTIIRTGFILHENIDNPFFYLNKMADRFTARAEPKAKLEFSKLIIEEAVIAYDLMTVADEKISFGEYLNKELVFAAEELKSPYKSGYDFRASVTCYPIKTRQHTNIIGVFFGPQKFEKMWFKQKYIKDFSYWNDTDKPKHVKENVWKHRKDTWDSVLSKSSIPALSGFTRTLFEIKNHYHLTLDYVKQNKLIPKLSARVTRLARDRAITEYIKSQEIKSWNSTVPYMQAIREFESLPNKKELIKEQEDFAKTKLKPARVLWKEWGGKC